MLYMAIGAFITIITGMVSQGPSWGWLQGVSIFVALFIIVAITSLNDWIKDKQFVRLQSLVKDETIPVIRGKYGATQSVNIYKLVVGDIILLEAGQRVPADCVLLESQDFTVDETMYYDDNRKATPKRPARPEEDTPYSDTNNANPFLLSNSLVASGSGVAVVCCVGARSRRGLKEEKLDTTSKTPLQTKLENLGGHFTKWGLYAAIAILIALVVNFIIRISAFEEYRTAKKIIKTLGDFFTVSVAVIVVAVPEGLPLTITLSLAYSVMRMKKDGVLVRNLDSPEVMGRVDEIITGKTGTMTKSEMKVDQFYSQSLLIRNTRKNTLFNCELFDKVIDLIQESILYNSDARIEMNDEAYYEPVGNGTEVGLIKFLQDAEIPVHDIIKQKLGRIETIIPFSTIRKRSLTAVRHPDNDDLVRVYIKGAPEIVVGKCSRTFHVDGKVIPLDDDQTNYILNDILIQKFTTAGYRTLAFAYKDLPIEDFESLKSEYNGFASEDDRQVLEKDLTFLGVFALHDPLRDRVNRSVLYAAKGLVATRLVSGDHIETAKALAVQAGIMDDPSKYTCLSGEEFRAIVGQARQVMHDDGTTKHQLERREEFRNLITGKENRKPLKVIARATAYDKYLLVVGLRDLGRTVATIGEGLNDLDALQNADVGFAMGSGVSFAKDNSDMILVNDNFEATMNAVMWGRNIYQNVRRFIQFQVTVNLTTLLVVFLGAATKGESPFSIPQLLWINLIMDTFAAIALGSERPHPSIIRNPPVKEKDPLMTTTMWKQIYGMTLYIFFITTIMYFFVDNMWDIEYTNDMEVY
jgi:Ca2+ transporting ATPase